jgi:hypothetical protein
MKYSKTTFCSFVGRAVGDCPTKYKNFEKEKNSYCRVAIASRPTTCLFFSFVVRPFQGRPTMLGQGI